MKRLSGNGERVAVGLAAIIALAAPASGQGIGERIAAVDGGVVRMAFAARPGLCGNGENWSYRRGNRDWESDCEPGPVRVALSVEAGSLTRIRSYVGGRWRPDADAIDLGTVPASDAAAYLLTVVRNGPDRAARGAMTAVSMADGVTFWPDFLDVARDEDRSQSVRKQALTLVTMEASRSLDDDDDAEDDPDRRIREQAVFALSQRPREEAVPRLIEITRTHQLAYIRRRALFWLGQTGDPRVIPVVEEVLRGR